MVGQFHAERAKSKDRLVDALCEGCGRMANFMCSACKGVHYCTTQCQVRWQGWACNENISYRETDGWCTAGHAGGILGCREGGIEAIHVRSV